MCRIVLLTIFAFLSLSAKAGSVVQSTKVTMLYTYGTYGTSNLAYRNDLQIKVENPISGCEGGYYISADDTLNNPTMVSFLLSAFHANSKVRISAYDDQLWDGSSAKHCRVNNLALER